MIRYFNREYKLVVGQPLRLNENSFSPLRNPAERLQLIDDLIQERSPNSLVLTQHNIRFEVDKSNTDTNKSIITVYNMSDRELGFIANLAGQKPVCRLEAGWVGNTKPIFVGQIERYEDMKQGQTRVTTLHLLDGAENIREAKSARSYPPNTPVDEIIEDLVGDMGCAIPAGSLVKLGNSVVTTKPIYFNASTMDGLWRLGQDYFFNYTINDMTSYVVPHQEQLPNIVDGVALSNETGLIGTIVRTDKTTSESTYDNSKPKTSIKFKMYLNGNLQPLYSIRVKDGDIDGVYKITSVRHMGELEGTPWYSEVEAEEVNDA